jgi:hypothetical protein
VLVIVFTAMVVQSESELHFVVDGGASLSSEEILYKLNPTDFLSSSGGGEVLFTLTGVAINRTLIRANDSK